MSFSDHARSHEVDAWQSTAQAIHEQANCPQGMHATRAHA
jgi:hypothetical protein